MSISRLENRVGNVISKGNATLKGFKLVFNKISKDGSGKANITIDDNSEVGGILYDLSEKQIQILDTFELGYKRELKAIISNGSSVLASVYIAKDEYVREGLSPTKEYLDFFTPTLKTFKYVFDKGSGPLMEQQLENETFTEGNCRLAIQYYLYKIKKTYLKPEEILLPNGYRNVGIFVFKEEPIDFSKLKNGDIIYAQNLRNRKDELLDRGKEKYKDENEWILYLHSAIYTGKKDNEIWHATAIEGSSCYWSLDKFLHYYLPVAVKRI